MVNIGNSNCTVYIGDTEVSAIYVGTTQIYPNSGPTPPEPSGQTDYTKEHLTFEIISGGTIYWTAGANASTKTIYYSKDNFVTSTGITSSTGGTAILVNAGDKLKFRASHSTYCDGGSVAYANRFMTSDVKFNLCGNIMSMINFNNFTGSTSLSGNYTFLCMFFQQSGLISAENLILPATTLSDGCYYHMFERCTSLTTAPALPATTLVNTCYSYMFNGCTSLTTAPELPATTLATQCYYGMFNGCSYLTKAPSILPATTLATQCYQGMFSGCTSLTIAPELPATTLQQNCYREMFRGCSSLNYIKCLTRTRLNTAYSYNWVYGVAASGTFVKNTGVNLSTGTSGIPQGWTQVIAS